MNAKISLNSVQGTKIMFIFFFCFFMLMHWIFNITEYPYDANFYWSLGGEMWMHGGWRLKSLTTGFRGVVLPIYFSICAGIGNFLGGGQSTIGFWLISSLTYAFMFSFVQKKILHIVFGTVHQKWENLICIVNAILSFVFFRGLFLYPLSDIYAFLLSLCSVVVLYKIKENQGIKQFAWAFLLGMVLYSEYNIRTIYLFPALAVMVLALYFIFKGNIRHLVWKTISVFAGIVGMALAALPQIIVNQNLNRRFSLAVPTDNLMLDQLSWGMKWCRYDTYIGDPSEYYSPSMYYIDSIGSRILELEAGEKGFVSFGDYFFTLLKHPLDVIGIFFRHLINILYPIFPNQYVQRLDGEKAIYLIIFYTILFIVCVNLLTGFKLSKDGMIAFGIVLVPCLFILPGAVEIRFFYPLYYLIFSLVLIGIRKLWERVRCDYWKFGILYLVGLGIYIAGCQYMLTSLLNATVLLG